MVDLLNKVNHGDCLELFKQIPDNSIDVTFADPPFNLKKKYNTYADGMKFNEYLEWCEKWISEMVRVTKLNGSIFLHNIPKWLTYYATFLNKTSYFKHWIAWDAPTAPMGKSLQPSHYGILYYVNNIKENKFYEIRHPHKRDRRFDPSEKDGIVLERIAKLKEFTITGNINFSPNEISLMKATFFSKEYYLTIQNI